MLGLLGTLYKYNATCNNKHKFAFVFACDIVIAEFQQHMMINAGEQEWGIFGHVADPWYRHRPKNILTRFTGINRRLPFLEELRQERWLGLGRFIMSLCMCLEIWMAMAVILYKYGEEKKIKMKMMSNMMVRMVMVVKVVVTSKRASEHVANTLGGRVPTTSHLIRWGWSSLLCWCWWRGSPWAWFPKVAKVGEPSNPQQCLPPHPPAHIFILEVAHLSVWSSWQ